MQYLHRATWKKKPKRNRGLGFEGNPGLGSPRELTGEEKRGLFPSGSERPELDPEELSDVEAESRENQEARRPRRSSDENRSE